MAGRGPGARPADAELVARAVAGDRQAFEELVRVEEGFMYALAMGRLGDAHLARDAVQEALLSAWKGIAGLRDARAFHSWLGRIVINAAVGLGQKKRDEEHAPLEAAADAPAAGEAGGDAAAAERRRQLAAAVAELDEDKQLVLAMHYSRGLGYAEIAGRLGITEDAVRGRLFQAREALRARLKVGRP